MLCFLCAIAGCLLARVAVCLFVQGRKCDRCNFCLDAYYFLFYLFQQELFIYLIVKTRKEKKRREGRERRDPSAVKLSDGFLLGRPCFPSSLSVGGRYVQTNRTSSSKSQQEGVQAPQQMIAVCRRRPGTGRVLATPLKETVSVGSHCGLWARFKRFFASTGVFLGRRLMQVRK